MSKVNFYNIPDNEKSIIFQHIANTKNMVPFAVEKDWWVVQTLAVIFGKHPTSNPMSWTSTEVTNQAYLRLIIFSYDTALKTMYP